VELSVVVVLWAYELSMSELDEVELVVELFVVYSSVTCVVVLD
jgi:hypothetical protein